jgi:1,2-phenylacetyl-CoA epoxidase catalytic subunit
MTFIKFEKLIHQIYRKKNKPQQVIEFLNDWFAKFIDLLSDTLDQLEMSLNSYGLTKKEESLLDLM